MLDQSSDEALDHYGSVTILSSENGPGNNNIKETSSSSPTSSYISLTSDSQSDNYVDAADNESFIAFPTIFTKDAIKGNQNFIPHCSILARVVEVEKSSSFNHPFNPYLYVIEITHGEFQWKVKKRYHHFRKLDADLLFHRAMKAGERKAKDPGRLSFAPANLIQNREERQHSVETYLQQILNKKGYYQSRSLQEFFETSRISFVRELGMKRREGMLLKRSGGHVSPHLAKCCCCFPQCCCYVWRKRWFAVKDTFIVYLDPSNHEIRGLLLLDDMFSIKPARGVPRGLALSNRARELVILCWTHRKQSEWMTEVVKVMGNTGSLWTQRQPYGSYAPPRKNAPAKWFVDGEDYFFAVAKALDEAKEEIYITDWWFSPELHMIRPATEGNYWRLDEILKRRAKEGVLIYVILYKEMEMALTIQSAYTKSALLKLHPTNIKVLRHPDHTPGKTGILYWAHHEKIVCIDQKVVFLGGLDLCYGRWDNHKHYLTDYGSAFVPVVHSRTERELASIGNFLFQAANIAGVSSHAEPREELASTNKAPQDGIKKGKRTSKRRISTRKMLGRARLWMGKDYSNPIKKDFVELDKPYQDIIDRGKTNRMPWHDVAVCCWGRVARDVARHFIQRWNFTKQEKKKDDPFFPILLPKTYSGLSDVAPAGIETTNVTCQIIRSVGKWSAGISVETSIYNAYIELIKNSKHYIYIENQFFITSLPPLVSNVVGQALVDRITRAHKKGENFKLYIVMPLLPAFEGEVGQASGNSICVITHWNYMSLCRGEESIVETLKRNGVENPFDYISMCSLRKHEEMASVPITELIYVHSKVMIVDDRYAIIGSANINDRSLLGKRDSEIAVLVQDQDFVSSKMDGNDYKAGVFTSGLRCRLMREHLGLLDSVDNSLVNASVDDPVSDLFFKDIWSATAENNTRIYEEVFHCLPSDNVEQFEDLDQYKSMSTLVTEDVDKAREMLKDVQGHLVNLPLKFLQLSNLRPPTGSKEGLVTYKIFT